MHPLALLCSFGRGGQHLSASTASLAPLLVAMTRAIQQKAIPLKIDTNSITKTESFQRQSDPLETFQQLFCLELRPRLLQECTLDLGNFDQGICFIANRSRGP